MKLEGKVAIVTGGTMGLGMAVAERFVQDGMDVVTCSRSGDPGPGHHIRADVSLVDDVDKLVAVAKKYTGRIDILVCNAAIYGPVKPLEETSLEEWQQCIDINLIGTMLCCRAVLPIMKQQGYGKIITLAGGGVRPQPNCTAYNASKAGVVRFTEALADDVAGWGIDVNAVAPGTLDTRMRLRSALPADSVAAMRRAVDLIAFLASSWSDGITGRLLSAVWDDWLNIPRDLDGHRDTYRMRRVVP
jgi:NAD(P)-dependent dehydrogenase (short-subunit alcohol dehydrogenase family)